MKHLIIDIHKKHTTSELDTIIIDSVVVIKITIMMGLIGVYFVPPEIATLVGVGSNLIWLWKV